MRGRCPARGRQSGREHAVTCDACQPLHRARALGCTDAGMMMVRCPIMPVSPAQVSQPLPGGVTVRSVLAVLSKSMMSPRAPGKT